MNPIRELWHSVFRRDPLSTGKGKAELVFHNLWLHIHPTKVHRERLKLTHTWYLGFITFYLFLVLVTTGVALMFYYRPHPPEAYQDMKDLQFVVFLGPFLRNMHRWAAHGMVICVFLHMCRVFYTGSYKRPRPFAVFNEPICVPQDADRLRESGAYPSGHASLGWTWALILAELVPERADAIFSRGRAFGDNRVVCGVHWPSDVQAGQTIAAAVVARLHAKPEFVAEMQRARAELAQAALSPRKPDCALERAALADAAH